MLTNQSHSWQDEKLRSYLDGYKDTLKALSDIALIRYCGVDFHPMVYGFILPLYKFTDDNCLLPRYIFAIYAKLPGVKILYVSDDIFRSLDVAKEKTQFYLQYFPLYGRLKRNIYQNPYETSL